MQQGETAGGKEPIQQSLAKPPTENIRVREVCAKMSQGRLLSASLRMISDKAVVHSRL